MEKKYSIGGQALIEGVMMRGPKEVAYAVRNASGTMVTKKWEHDADNKPQICKVPFIRGIFNFIDSMKLGYKTLLESADITMMYDEEDENNPDNANKLEMVEVDDTDGLDKEKGNLDSKKTDEEGIGMTILMTISSLLGIALAIGLFIWLPTFLFNLLKGVVPVLNKGVWQSVFEGVLKIVIFIVYVSVVSLMEDMRRVFMYHGAEHKTIFCYENGLELTVENVRKQKRFHPRCGTSFIAIMLIIGIVVGLFIPHEIPSIYRAIIKIMCLPIVMGVGYEAIKFAGKHDNAFVRIMSAPGLWIQRITTKEPDDDMIECAIAAFKAVLPS